LDWFFYGKNSKSLIFPIESMVKIAKNRKDYYEYPRQTVKIQKIPNGTIIDIGGGGEGIIAQIGKEKVTAVDKLQSEIDEGKPNAPEAIWVHADATDLEFPDAYFDNATAFFSGMYMTDSVLEKVFEEIKRLIPKNGELWIWDAEISYEIGPFIIPIRIITPAGKEIRTAYGKRQVSSNRSVERTKYLLGRVGFTTHIESANDFWFFIKAKK
jgi:ubiquinone/menaquinone biosynthesis C-methylase UbiE